MARSIEEIRNTQMTIERYLDVKKEIFPSAGKSLLHSEALAAQAQLNGYTKELPTFAEWSRISLELLTPKHRS